MDFGLKIENGRVFDGSGTGAFFCDIGICGDSIAKMGRLSDASAKKTIDAAGCIVCPGFIDAHSHSDAYLLIEPSAASKVHQGVTTEICGHCGASAAPLLGACNLPADWTARLDEVRRNTQQSAAVPAPWKTVADYRERFAEARPAINAALLVGHNTLHAGCCGYEPRAAAPDEFARMGRALEQALDEGAIGLSSGLAYPPGSAVPPEELAGLAGIVARRGGTYATHLRSESDRLLEAIGEALDTARRAGVRLQIAHLKASGQRNWPKLGAALDMVRAAIDGGLPAGCDRYPYTAGSTDLDIVLPGWASHGGRATVLARLRDPGTRRRIGDELRESPPGRWGDVMVGSTQFEAFKGKYLPEVAAALGMDEVDALLHLVDADGLGTGGIFFGMSEENLWRVLAEPHVSLGSDGSLRAPTGPLAADHPHPRAYGSHTRFLRAALDGRTVPLAEAIRKMTSLPAEQFGLAGRGLLKEGCAADLAILDPSAVEEKATYARPHQLSEGLRHLVVNGTHTVENGLPTGRRGGRFLARNE